MARREQAKEPVLRGVGVLVLVDVDIKVTVLVSIKRLLRRFQQLDAP